MSIRLSAALDPVFARFDDIIDVRSPSEFAQDHLPGAINLPVLSDAERAQVGTIYKQVSPFDARKFGASLVAANAARHISGPLRDREGGWRPLIYCWRGGQRSGSFATILSQIGWRAELVEGGYKAWRRLVVDRVQLRPVNLKLIVLDGNTGSAKTRILHKLAAAGQQIIDLEALACHRGSLFGAVADQQPAQRMFEGLLAQELDRLDPSRPVLIEAESSRIGELSVPGALWKAICAAPRIMLEVPLAARAAYSVRDYGDIISDPARLVEIVGSLRSLHSADQIAQWLSLIETRDWHALAEGLMRDHYDPRYRKHRARYVHHEIARIALESLTDLGRAADRIALVLSQRPV